MQFPATAATECTAGTPSVLIVDDDARVRQLLKAILLRAFPTMTFGEAKDVPDMLAKIAKQPWHALLLDIMMPGRSGLDALPEIKATYPRLPVLVVSTHDEALYAEAAVAAGATGYVRKDNAPDALGAAVRALLFADRNAVSPKAVATS